MLASITPLGERSRGFSWHVTATWFAAGAVLAGAVGGAVLGAVGGLISNAGAGWRGPALLAVLLLALAFELRPLRSRLPSTRRQVNEDWLSRYRGWVYGGAFGAQLGVGVATIVTSAAIYATVAAALICGSPAAGAAIGGLFGAVRALSLVPARHATDADGLRSVHVSLMALELPARRRTLALELGVVAFVIACLA
jgi:MFS family permease